MFQRVTLIILFLLLALSGVLLLRQPASIGHPDALAIAARMLSEGVAFDRQPMEAAAYAYAAELAGAPLASQAHFDIVEILSADETAKARTRGETLYREWKKAN